MSPLVLAFGFRARHGKDTAAQAIIEERSGTYDVRRYAFASELKREMSAAIAACGNAVNFFAEWDKALPDWVVMEADPDMTDPLCPYGKYRTLAQWWGTEYRRAQDADYWVRRTTERITADNPAVAIITDLRFLNEGRYVAESGGYRVKVTRTGYTSDVPQHKSETILEAVSPLYWQHELEAATTRELRAKALGFFDYVVEKERVPRRVQA